MKLINEVIQILLRYIYDSNCELDDLTKSFVYETSLFLIQEFSFIIRFFL